MTATLSVLPEGAAPATPMTMFADPRFGKLTPANRTETIARVSLCQRIDAAACKAAAIRTETLRTHAGTRLSEGAIRKLYYEKWAASGGDWWETRNAARIPEDSAGLPEATRAWWHQLVFVKGGRRRAKAAWREADRIWHSGAEIPGLAEPSPRPRTADLPEGLSYRNLMHKRNRPSKLLGTVAAVGLKAAAPHLPGVLTTRAGLSFGARYVFDDLKHDFMVTVPGQLGLRELWQFHCLELLSGYQVARGFKAAALNAKTDSMEKLKERELLFLVAHLFCGIGYNADGCIGMFERGTSTVREATERVLHDYSRGAIVVQRGATSTGAPAPGLYGGQSGGNPRFKAALESLGHLVHIETSDRLLLPAQTGSNARLDRPEELYGREHHLTQLQKAALVLPAEERALLRLPGPPLWQTIALVDAIQARMNERDDHELEGWDACGFVVPMWRLHEQAAFEPQTSLALLAPDERALIERRLQANPRLTTARRLAPAEVFRGYASTLTRLPPHALPALIGLEHSKEKRVGKDGDFHFEDDDVGPGEHHYSGVVTDGDHTDRLASGEKYAVFVSAIDPSRLYACDAKGRFIGWCERVLVPSKADAHGFARAMGRRMQAHQELLAPVLAAARPLWKRMTDDADANDTMFARAAGRDDRTPLPRRPSPQQNARNAGLAAQFAAQAAAQQADDPPL